jgi:hypothetical protein
MKGIKNRHQQPQYKNSTINGYSFHYQASESKPTRPSCPQGVYLREAQKLSYVDFEFAECQSRAVCHSGMALLEPGSGVEICGTMWPDMMILIAGPYRSGTNDDPALIQKNIHEMESYALPIFRAGHIPLLGEWFALPLVALAGSKKIGDDAFNEIFHPIAVRLLEKCDAVLRVGGPSAGADEMVRVGQSKGLQIYKSLAEIPKASQ